MQSVILRSPMRNLASVIENMAMDMDPIVGHVPANIILIKNGQKQYQSMYK